MLLVYEIPSSETWNLRHRVLRPLPANAAECAFPGDEDPGTFHLGAFLDGKLVGIATFMQEPFAKAPEARLPVRLRGMASDPDFRRRGIGRALVQEGERKLTAKGSNLLWFNAREVAFPFYEALGYVYASEMFDIPGVGPHRVMFKPL